jgi:hypothetical protein
MSDHSDNPINSSQPSPLIEVATTTSPSTLASEPHSGSSLRVAHSAAEYTPARKAFVALTNKRVGRAIESIRLVGRLAVKQIAKDSYTEAEVAVINAALKEAVDAACDQLYRAHTGRQLDAEFDLTAAGG